MIPLPVMIKQFNCVFVVILRVIRQWGLIPFSRVISFLTFPTLSLSSSPAVRAFRSLRTVRARVLSPLSRCRPLCRLPSRWARALCRMVSLVLVVETPLVAVRTLVPVCLSRRSRLGVSLLLRILLVRRVASRFRRIRTRRLSRRCCLRR